MKRSNKKLSKKKNNYEPKNYSNLLAQLQDKQYVAELRKSNLALHSYMEEQAQEQKPDEEVRFILDPDSGLVHDKNCGKVRNKKGSLISFEKLPKNKAMCPYCARRIMVRQLSGSDNPNVQKNFLWFINEKGIKTSWLDSIYQNQDNVRMHLVSNDVLRVLSQHDMWEVDFTEERPKLFHGNYTVSTRGEKQICMGMHEEDLSMYSDKDVIQTIFYRIAAYSWKKHLDNKRQAAM